MKHERPRETHHGQREPLTLGRAIGIAFGIGLVCGCAGVVYQARVLGLAAADAEAGGWSLLSTSLLLSFGILPLLLLAQETPSNIAAGGITGMTLGLLYGLLTSDLWNGLVFGTCLGLGTSFVVSRIVPPTVPASSVIPARILPAVGAAFVAAHFTGWLPPTQLIPKSEYLHNREDSEQLQNPGSKLSALKAVAAQLKKFPDRFAPDSERTAYNAKLRELIDNFTNTAFRPQEHPSTAKAIVELFEEKIEGKFSGHLYDILMEHVQNIYAEALDR